MELACTTREFRSVDHEDDPARKIARFFLTIHSRSKAIMELISIDISVKKLQTRSSNLDTFMFMP